MIAVFVASLHLISAGIASAVDLGVVGKTYSIAERDGAEELRERVNAVNWKEVLAKSNLDKKTRSFKPANLKSLPRALKDRARIVNMDYSLEYDITDGNGNVVYPKGYTFNPLDFMTYTRTIVVLNGDDRDQVEWFKSSKYLNKPNVMVLITDGNYYDLSAELGQPVFFVDERIVRRFQLRAVPSVIAQKNRMMEVSEFEITLLEKVGINK